MTKLESDIANLNIEGENQPSAQEKTLKKEKKKNVSSTVSGHPLEITPRPSYIDHRIQMFEELKKKQDEEAKAMPREPIEITLPDGSVKEATSWETCPMDIAKSLAKSLAEKVVIAKVDDVLWDLERPFEKSSKLQLLTFDDEEGKFVFWHSSAHVLGEACERHYGCNLCIGPPIDEGFYYEMDIADRNVELADYEPLETIAKSAIKEKQPFERLLVSKENLLKMFKDNKFKVRIINDKIPDGTSTTVYRCGPLIDLCKGPHVPHTGRIKAFAVMKNSSSYFYGNAANESLQRIYGISFPDTKQMTEHKHFIAEAAKRDHRRIGKEQELFFFHDLSPGSCFFLPHGARIYNTLMDFIKEEYRKRGYTEVMSPNMFNTKLWETSGHWENYRENMFTFEVEKETFGLKPMNCPGHCVMFGHRERSYRELPIRYADFGVLHRNEASGALTGLTRVRRFCQDDAHIFCTQDQLEQEIDATLDFLRYVYGIFGFTFHLKLSTRPEKFLGEISVWDNAEKKLEMSLNKFSEKVGCDWELNPGDGAFYGPKIDIVISDALRRKHQCATVQLDFQLPERFELSYRTDGATSESEQYSRPVIIHRAMLGSVERMIAILTENFGGLWPFWLSPRQVCVIPVAAPFNKYAEEVRKACAAVGLFADADLGVNTLNKKIRNAEIAHYNFVFVVGEEEETTQSVNIRNRDDVGTKAKTETIPLEAAIQKLVALNRSRSKENKLI